MRTWRIKLLPVFLTLALLGVAAADALSRPRPKDAEPFHQRVREAEASIPAAFGEWELQKEQPKPQPEAIQLLRPNVIVQRVYRTRSDPTVYMTFLLVQCKDARDMAGHYPPICYKGAGFELRESSVQDWTVDGQTITGREYHFVRSNSGSAENKYIWNFFVMPDGRFVRDMEHIYSAAGDYLRRFYGAAQVQVIFPEHVLPERRRAYACELMKANKPMLDALRSGGKSQ